ncbi:MAG: 50S ribosomal protein L29, partial [Deltaproteobacteria bacterium]
MKPDQLRKLPVEDLAKKKSELTQELFNLKFQLHTG